MTVTHSIPNVHPNDEALFWKADDLAWAVAKRFGFELRNFEAKRRPNADGATGLCYASERRISVILRYRDLQRDGGKWWSKPLPWSDIWDTVIHEVCHLPHRVLSHHKNGHLPDNQQHRQLQAAIRAVLRSET